MWRDSGEPLAPQKPRRDEGIAKLGTPLRQRPLQVLLFGQTGITDKGVASLLSNLGEEEFQQLEMLFLQHNQISDAGCAMLVSIIDSGKLPAIQNVGLLGNPASDAARQAVYASVTRATHRRL